MPAVERMITSFGGNPLTAFTRGGMHLLGQRVHEIIASLPNSYAAVKLWIACGHSRQRVKLFLHLSACPLKQSSRRSPCNGAT